MNNIYHSTLDMEESLKIYLNNLHLVLDKIIAPSSVCVFLSDGNGDYQIGAYINKTDLLFESFSALIDTIEIDVLLKESKENIFNTKINYNFLFNDNSEIQYAIIIRHNNKQGETLAATLICFDIKNNFADFIFRTCILLEDFFCATSNQFDRIVKIHNRMSNGKKLPDEEIIA